jgi:hypothetical protein
MPLGNRTKYALIFAAGGALVAAGVTRDFERAPESLLDAVAEEV